jgi:GNAT superfamily N-acetyltransferase
VGNERTGVGGRPVAPTVTANLTVREATDGDLPAVLDLLQASLGWVPDDDYARFFAWKHHESPFGRSPAWVAVDREAGDRVVGFRTFSRWRFDTGGETVPAVRAVDTATHPDYQGRGIFSLLTRHALEALRDEGVAFVFNTPNDKSRPGYLKMGWQLVERLPVAATVRSPGSLVRLARARTPADKWSAPSSAGVPVSEVLADAGAVEALLAAARPDPGHDQRLRTARTPEFLAWRYGFAPLHYRAVVAPGGVADGVVVFRVRRRGAALEAAVCEQIVPVGDDRTAPALVRRALRETRADHAVQIGRARPARGQLPVPGQGPTLVWRDVSETDMPPADRWALGLGDIELF